MRVLSEREMVCDLTNSEVVDVVKKEAEELGGDFTGYVVEVEAVESYFAGKRQYPGYHLLKVIANCPHEHFLRGEGVYLTVTVARGSDEESDGLALYERGKELVALLKAVAGTYPVDFRYPESLFASLELMPHLRKEKESTEVE